MGLWLLIFCLCHSWGSVLSLILQLGGKQPQGCPGLPLSSPLLSPQERGGVKQQLLYMLVVIYWTCEGSGSEEILLGRRLVSQREENEQYILVPQILPSVGGATRGKVLQGDMVCPTVADSMISCLAL